MRTLTLAIVVASWAAVVIAQATPGLSPDDLNAAIAAAKAAPPAAYKLRGPSKPVTRQPNGVLPPEVAKTLDPKKILTFGEVYTPFIRAAILARKAGAGKPFTAADIPADIQDSLTYLVVVPWERTDATGPDRLVDAEYVVLTPTGSTERAQTIQPAWVKTDTMLLRKILGAAVPARGMVAAFPRDEVQGGRDVVIVYGGSGVYAQRVEIRAADAASWR